MDNLGNLITLVFGGISSIAILIYYLNPNESECFDCQDLISHHKESRYRVTVNNEVKALCKKCSIKRKKQDELVAQNCSCCLKKFTTRMKIHEWETVSRVCFLCSECNRKGKLQLTDKFQLSDVLTDEFIHQYTNANSLQEYFSTSKVKIDHQSDLNSQDWDAFVKETSKFESWKSMEAQALSELYSRNRKVIVEKLS